MSRFDDLVQLWPMPSSPRPIIVIGAGGIVESAHLPAYRKWGFEVAGIFDLEREKAKALADRFSIPRVFGTLEEAFATGPGPVHDIAVPPQALSSILPLLTEGATALIQKPLGVDAADARKLAAVLSERRVTAAVNFQLRFTPAMVAVGDAIARGMFGDIVELEVRLACRTPWEIWPFMKDLDAIEIPLHSIHYLDWIRATLGMPDKVFAKSVRHPAHPDRADARSSIILDAGPMTRCCLSLNHTHLWGPDKEEATIRIEGTKAAAIIGLGYLVNFPDGRPESLEMIVEGGQWETVPLKGERVPDSFAAVMANLQRYAAGEDEQLLTGIEDSVRSMLLVDACLKSSRSGEAVAPDNE